MATIEINAEFPLTHAKCAVSLVVTEVRLDGPDATRLQAMGICRGRRVELVKGGDPLIVRVLGSRVGLCGRLAAQVVVRRADTPSLTPESLESRVA